MLEKRKGMPFLEFYIYVQYIALYAETEYIKTRDNWKTANVFYFRWTTFSRSISKKVVEIGERGKWQMSTVRPKGTLISLV